jgi:hypothetical protein
LQDADTGEPVVEEVGRADVVFGEQYIRTSRT